MNATPSTRNPFHGAKPRGDRFHQSPTYTHPPQETRRDFKVIFPAKNTETRAANAANRVT